MVKAERWQWLGRVGLCLAMMGACPRWTASSSEVAPAWPKHFDAPQGRCTVFQPQPTTLEGDHLTAKAALAVVPAGATNFIFGVAQVEGRVARDLEQGQVSISEITVGEPQFLPADAAAMLGLADALRPGFAGLSWSLSNEALEASLQAARYEQAAARGLKLTPPRILYSPTPAVLIVLDGPPQLRPVADSPLMRVVNTPYAMLFEPEQKRYWLQGSETWFSAPDWTGAWSPAAQPPEQVAAAVPKETTTKAPSIGGQGGTAPHILVSSEPAELIVTRGEPVYTPVPGNEILSVSNSDQLLFLELTGRQYYVVLSGRWYRSAALHGPWDLVPSGSLPAAFARIPPGSPKSEALTYIAGTTEANDAVLRANIPQITAVNRGPTNLEVTYDGAPRFEPVPDTAVQSAVNTPDAVFLVAGVYYICRDAVWYTGPGPEGPWSVATFVPAEIQSLPPSHPHYNVKYVYVYGTTPSEVYVGYVPAYAGCYVAGPTIVYGTGWWYPGYYGPSCYWAYPATFGFGFGYSSWSGWSVGFSFGYGWLSCGYGWGWGGCYPVGWWGPCGAYWSCPPRYPCYATYPAPHGTYAGAPAGSPAGGPHLTRADPRKDAPTPYGRPSNPQRRTLPEYAREVKAPFRAPTALASARSGDFKTGISPRPSRGFAPTRTSGLGTATSAPQRMANPAGMNSRAPARSSSLTANGSRVPTSSPARTDTPARVGQGAATSPQRSPDGVRLNPSGRSSSPSAYRTPATAQSPSPRRSSVPMSPTFNQPPTYGAGRSVTRIAPSPARPGGSPVMRSPTPSFAPAPGSRSTWRSSSPSFGGFRSAPTMRAPSTFSAPPMRSASPGSFTAPTRAAPMGRAPGFSGGNMGRAAPTRGR